MENQANAVSRRVPWNKGKVTGAKPPLRPKHVWSIRTKLQIEGRTRDLAMFNLAIDSKLRGCDVVTIKVEDVAASGYTADRATVRQKKTGRPVRFELGPFAWLCHGWFREFSSRCPFHQQRICLRRPDWLIVQQISLWREPLMMLLPDFREARPRFRSDWRTTRDGSSRAASRLLAGSSHRLAHSTAHMRIAGRASCHSPIRISCGTSQCEAEHGIGPVEDIRRGSAKVISAIGIVPVSLDLFRGDANVLSVFSSLRINVAVDVFDFGRVAVRIIATADGWIIGHVPC